MTQAERKGEQRLQARARTRSTLRVLPDSSASDHNSKFLSRRNLLIGGGIVAASVTGAFVLSDVLERRVAVDPYETYLSAFESIAAGDSEAQALFDFWTDRRKTASVSESGDIHAAEAAELGVNFFTGVIPKAKGSTDPFSKTPLLSLFDVVGIPVVLMRDVEVEKTWAGSEMVRCAQLVHDAVLRNDRTAEGFLEANYKAYSLAFRLLNKETQGHLNISLAMRAKLVRQESTEVIATAKELSDDDFRAISSTLNPPKSEDEIVSRRKGLLVALNFSVIDLHTTTASENAQFKQVYLAGLMQG